MMALSAVFIFTLIWDKCPIGGIPLCIYIYSVSFYNFPPFLWAIPRLPCWNGNRSLDAVSKVLLIIREFRTTERLARDQTFIMINCFFFFCESWWYLVIVNLNLINLVVLLFSFHVFNWKQHVICFFFAKFIWLGKIASIWAGQGMS